MVSQPPTLTRALAGDTIDMGNAGADYETARSLFWAPIPARDVMIVREAWRRGGLTYFSKGIEKTQIKRDRKAALLASVREGSCEPAHGMTKDQAIMILSQDIADYDEILAGLRRQL
jgi:hypothetical protein